MSEQRELRKAIIFLSLGTIFAAVGGINIYRHVSDRIIPKQTQVQEGYITPNRLEIECEDWDKTDREELPETYIKIDGKTYLLKYDENGKPTILEYEVKPSEVIPIE